MLNHVRAKNLFGKVVTVLIVLGLFTLSISSPAKAVTPEAVLSPSTSELGLTSTYTWDIMVSTDCLVGPHESFVKGFLKLPQSFMTGANWKTADTDTGITLDRSLGNVALLACMTDPEVDIVSDAVAQEILTRPALIDTPYMLADSLYNNPTASGIVYAQQLFQKATNPGVVYADALDGYGMASPYFPGLGYEALEAIQATWGWLVNFVYGIMIVIILGISFGLLFQNSLGGKQSVQLATAIPNIVVAMVLIPLSYPIAGFAVDFLTLGANAVHGVLLSGPNALGSAKYSGGSGKVKVNIDLNFRPLDINDLVDFFFPPGDNETEFNRYRVIGTTPTGNRGFYIDDPRVSVHRAFTLIDISNLTDFIEDNPIESTLSRNVRTFLEDKCIASGGTPGTTDTLVCTVDLVALSIGNFFSSSLGYSGLGTVVADVIVLVLSYFLFFTGASLFMKLFIKYINLVLLPILSPVVMATVAIPGTGTKVVIWFLRSLYGSAFFFVVTYAAILFIMLLSQNGVVTPEALELTGDKTFIPPLMGFQTTRGLAISGVGFKITTAALLDVVAIAMFFGLPRFLARLEDSLQLKFKIPDVLKDVGAGFQASRGVAGATTRAAASVVEGASRIPRAALRASVRSADQRAPLGTTGYIEQQKVAAATRARQNAYFQQSTNPLTRAWAKTGGAAMTRLRNEVTLAGTGVTAAEVAPKFATKLNWNFVSTNTLKSQTNIVIRSIAVPSDNTYRSDIEFSIAGEGQNRIYGQAMFTNAGGGTNKIALELRGNPNVKATLTIANGSVIDFSGSAGTGTPNNASKVYDIVFHNGTSPGNVYQPVGGTYSFWYRPTPASPQSEDKRPLTVTLQ